MRFDPSISQFVHNPTEFHLEMVGDTLKAVEKNPTNHRITQIVFNELKALASSSPEAKEVVEAIHEQIIETAAQSASLSSRIWNAVSSLWSSRELPNEFQTHLQEWCEEKIGTEEYPQRIKALQKIRDCYLNQSKMLNVGSMSLSSLPDLSALSQLQILFCSDNELTALPESIGDCSQLQMLNCYSNRFATLPESIGNCFQLKILDCEKNQLTAIPASIGNCSKLQKLDCHNNSLTALPESIGNCSKLQTLRCSQNKLTALPESIGNCSQLQELNCVKNQLTALPESIGNCSQLQKLNCAENRLTALPESIDNCSELQELNCFGNLLVTLPESIGNCSKLQELNCFSNRLTALPECIGNCSQLQILECSANQLTTLPESIGNCSQLQKLNCSINLLATLPECIGNCSQLQTLESYSNRLTALPGALARLLVSCSGNFEDNRLSPESIELFQAAITAERAVDPTHGPQFNFSIHDANPLHAGASLEENLTFWIKAFQQAFPKESHQPLWSSRSAERFPPTGPSSSQNAFLSFYEPLLTHPDKENLKIFLAKLKDTEGYKNPRTRNNLVLRLDQILESACRDPEFRELFFPILGEAVATCGDRAIWGFNQLDLLWRLHCEAKNLSNSSLAELIIGLERVEQVREIAALDVADRRAHPSEHRGIDEIEVFLYYQVKLKEALKLPITTEGMLYPSMSDVTDAKLLAAKEKVVEQTSSPDKIALILAGSEVWQERIQKEHREEFDAINERLLEKIEAVTAKSDLTEKARADRIKNLQKEQTQETKKLIHAFSLSWTKAHYKEIS